MDLEKLFFTQEDAAFIHEQSLKRFSRDRLCV